MMPAPGPILLLGSGETSPGMQRVYHHLFSQMEAPIRVAVLETPAGFEPNSADVAAQVGAYLEKRLQNFKPQVDVIPARRRGTAFSPDDPALAARLHGANVIFLGPGSPTYAVRQLQGSRLWETVRACHRQGAALILASAATLAVSRHTIPIYEIYKVGEDLHWKPGLDFLGDFGLATVIVPHWNNNDGGERLDTSRCYMGQARFEQLVAMVPGGAEGHTLVGIDESTALLLEPAGAQGAVMGSGRVSVQRGGPVRLLAPGERFALDVLGPFALPDGGAGLDPHLWSQVEADRAALAAAQPQPTPDAAVLALLEERQAARQRADWASADALRAAIAAKGWRVLDTAEGQRLDPA